jgi:hypothetical protein
VAGIEEAIYSFYGHIEANGYVQEGDWVDKRQQLGIIGDPVSFGPHLHFEIKNRTALVNPPFSSCSDPQNGVYISAGYSGLSDDYGGGDYYDPTDSIAGNRYYHPSRFIENHKDEVPTNDCAEFEADLNYPDGTEVSPGETIRKGWQLSNCGDTTWRAADGYRAVRVSGDYGPGSFSIPTVGPGENGDLYADITVPNTAGTHRATYQLDGPRGPFGTQFWVEVKVKNVPNPCISSVSADRWMGAYYNNMDLSGSPAMVRDDGDGFLDFDWGTTSPSQQCGIGADRFSVHWTRDVAFSAGTYRFTITSDDGFRMYIDSEVVLDKWIDQAATYSVDVPLTAGIHTLELEYYENGGAAVAKLSWEKLTVPTNDCSQFVADINYPDGTKVIAGETIRKGWRLSNCGDTTWSGANGYRAVRISGDYGPESFTVPPVGPEESGDLYADITVPDTPGTYRATYKLEGPWGIFGTEFWVEVEVQEIQDPCKADVSSDRWNGEYFKNMNLGGNPVMIRDDGDGFLDFDWGSGSPGIDCGVPADRFSVRWTRSIYVAAGTYRFTVVSDDGFRLYLDSDLALEKWFDQSPTTYIVDVALSEGNHTVVLEYYEKQGGAVAKLSWDAYEPGADSIWLETEWGQLNHPMQVVQDPSSASGAYIWIPNGGGTGGTVSYQFSVPQAGNYVIWGRVLAVNGLDDSFFVSVDGGSDALWDTQIATAWVWDRVSHRNGADPMTYYLQAGSHTLLIKQREDGTKIDKILITADMGYIPVGMGGNQTPGWCLTAVAQDRWQGEYFDNVNLEGQPVMVRDDGDGFLNFNWGGGSPGMQCGVAADRFSTRWTRQIYFNAGTYRFTVTVDDGVRLYVDDVPQLSEWYDQAPTTHTVEVPLSAGNHTVTLEYYENGGGAVAQLAWTQVAD